MADNSALILGDARSGLVAGLDWHYVSGSDSRSRIRDIRRQADTLEARRCVQLSCDQHVYVGFYTWDPFFSDEQRPARLYSFAALLSHRLHAPDAIVLWRIQQGPRQGDIALVVIEDHLPVADRVLSLADAKSSLARYRKSPAHAHDDTLWSNDLDEFPLARPMVLDWSQLKPAKGDRIKSLPVDPWQAATSLVGITLLVSGVLVGSEYAHHLEQRHAMQQAARQDQSQSYQVALEGIRQRLGVSSWATRQLLDDLMDQSAIAGDWSLREITCSARQCNQQWKSEGGYTSDLLKVLSDTPDAKPQLNHADTQTLNVAHTTRTDVSGVSQWSQLPASQTLRDLLFDEQQIWKKAGLTFSIDMEGQRWPAGFDNVSQGQTLKRHTVRISGSDTLIRNFLEDYNGLVFWDQLRIRILPFDVRQAVTIELQGAFYAY